MQQIGADPGDGCWQRWVPGRRPEVQHQRRQLPVHLRLWDPDVCSRFGSSGISGGQGKRPRRIGQSRSSHQVEAGLVFMASVY